jgi:hypothetical protein
MAKKHINNKDIRKTAPAAVSAVPEDNGGARNVAMILAAAALLAVFTAVEIIGPINKSSMVFHEPDLITRWKTGPQTKGVTSVYLYGNNLYYMDSTRGEMDKYDVMTGRYYAKYAVPQGIISMGQRANGDVLALSKQNFLMVFGGGSAAGPVQETLPGCGNAASMAVDSKDNILVLDAAAKSVIKYGPGLKIISEFGARELNAPERIYAGPDDRVYVLDYVSGQKIYAVIFSSTGKFIRKFKVMQSKQLMHYEGLAITPKGELYINDLQGGFVDVFSDTGWHLGRFKSASDGVSAIIYPAGICGGGEGFFVVPVYEALVMKNIKF